MVQLDEEFKARAESAARNPKLYRTGCVRGAREIVVRPNYVMVYYAEDEDSTVVVLRVLHAAQQWPPAT